VKISECVVARSRRAPITFTLYIPTGCDYETKILPVVGLMLTRSIPETKVWPSEISTPLYVQVFA
jgi:hypothetical protein